MSVFLLVALIVHISWAAERLWNGFELSVPYSPFELFNFENFESAFLLLFLQLDRQHVHLMLRFSDLVFEFNHFLPALLLKSLFLLLQVFDFLTELLYILFSELGVARDFLLLWVVLLLLDERSELPALVFQVAVLLVLLLHHSLLAFVLAQ